MQRKAITAAAAAALTLALITALGLMAGEGPDGAHGEKRPGHKGSGPHHTGPREHHKPPHHGPPSKDHGDGPTLEFELKGKGEHIELKCRARMLECLKALERVRALTGDAGERNTGRKDPDNSQ